MPFPFPKACSIVSLIASASLGLTGCPSNVETATGGPSSSSGGGGSSSSSGGGGSTSSNGGGGSTGCPQQAPDFSGDTVCSEEGLSCSYGSECCCGGCYDSYVCQCSGGTWLCYYTDACLDPQCETDACPGFAGEARYVHVDVGGEINDMIAACGSDDPSGPMALVYSNSKSGPQWYFGVQACLPGQDFPSILMMTDIPSGADIMVPFTSSTETSYLGEDGVMFMPSTLTTTTLTTFGAVHELVKGTLKGSVIMPSGDEVPIQVELSVCRRDDQIAL